MLTLKGLMCALLVFMEYALFPTESVLKTWKYSNDLQNPINWIGGAPQKDCKGVIFPSKLGSVATLRELYAEEIILPNDGEIEIRDGGFIEIKRGSPCIRIKKFQHHHWLDPNSWISDRNSAIPDSERVPCIHDDVTFSRNSTVSVYYPEVSTSVNSIEIDGMNVSNNQQWQEFLQSDYGGQQFYTLDYESEIAIRPTKCLNQNGCFCHYNQDDTTYWVCDYVEKGKFAPCLDPILPIGHCNNICGGIILLSVNYDFILEKFKTKIPKHKDVDFYASKVIKNDKPYVQVIFVEIHAYREISTKVAKDFHSAIVDDPQSYGVDSATLIVSGIYIPEGSQWATAMSIIFGTLVAVLVITILIYVVYMGPLANHNFSSRIPLGEISFRNLTPFVFAKFENREEGQMSMAASFVSLEKAFDNPMYGTDRPSTSSAVVDVVMVAETQPTKSETIHENPLFSETKSHEVEVEDVEEDVEE